ncbi:MAG: PH domain-containing protein [bacterium]|nr:PH domain-containing protein [bacterium]
MTEDYTFRGQRDDEDVLLIVKQNAWVFAKTGIIILILANVVVFALIMFGASGVFSYLLFIFVLAAGFLVGYRWYLWSNSNYMLTNQRIIKVDQSSIFHRVISEMELDRIQDISTEMKGPIQMMINFGTIHIKTASSNEGMELASVTDPYDVQQQIVKAHNLMKNEMSGKIEFQDSFGEEVPKKTKT